jgi:hypothetical protein
MIWLEHDEAREYDVVLRVLDGPRQIAQAESAIRSAAVQPSEDCPRRTGVFARLRGR